MHNFSAFHNLITRSRYIQMLKLQSCEAINMLVLTCIHVFNF